MIKEKKNKYFITFAIEVLLILLLNACSSKSISENTTSDISKMNIVETPSSTDTTTTITPHATVTTPPQAVVTSTPSQTDTTTPKIISTITPQVTVTASPQVVATASPNIQHENSVDKSVTFKGEDMINGVKDINTFIPEGWHILKAYGNPKVEGDLNADGISDIAFVIEGIKEEKSSAPRLLLIATGNTDKSFNLALKADKVILRSDEGGMMGEPFMGLSIDRGSLLISHNGGSAWRWCNTYRFRYQNGGWYLIWATEDWFHAVSNAGRKYEDINLLTGDYIMIETDNNGVEKKTEGNRGMKTLINLIDFKVGEKRRF